MINKVIMVFLLKKGNAVINNVVLIAVEIKIINVYYVTLDFD